MKMKYNFVMLFTGFLLTATVAAQPFMEDDFSSGDLSKSMNGFQWSGIGSSADVSNPVHVRETTGRNGETTNALHFRYRAGSNWVEKRFDTVNPHRELWVRYWIKVPENYQHGSGSPHNNKFFAIWMDGYSSKGEGPTVFWNYWRSSEGATLTVSNSRGQKRVSGPNVERVPFIRVPQDRGRWMQVVLRVKAATNRSSNDGIIETYRRWENEDKFTKIQEVRDADIAVPPSGPDGWRRGYVMGYANAAYAQDTTWIIDDMAFSSSSLLQTTARPLPPHPHN
ncbi:hypothetical protein [Marinimicrobium sp. ABcell2]|uniref:hypothetical protein n=1 Tax=Marinimicrobium sp. ABcell2 TaxID=3069751 RepID=UPI0027B64C5E|nr:hypothetical protein [Marinimicrobium sp. ABcell2]MDQ2076172.1 hypothetical protein [Marinimicrobium sp. ABcell2]